MFRVYETLSGLQGLQYVLDTKPRDFMSVFLNMRAETLDDGYYPSKGYSVGLGYKCTYAFGQPYQDSRFFHTLEFDAKFVWRLNDMVAAIPQFYSRMIFGDKVPLPFANMAGGDVPGRYLEQQIPFMGIDNAIICQKNFFMLRNDVRFELAKDTYLGFVANYALDLQDLAEFNPRHLFGVGVGVAYDSIAGPLKMNFHWSNATKFGVYLSMGFDF